MRLDKNIYWGVGPGLADSGDSAVSGQLVAGDYIHILTPNTTDDGEIRVLVYSHDGRTVGKARNKVWISYTQMESADLNLVLTCEEGEFIALDPPTPELCPTYIEQVYLDSLKQPILDYSAAVVKVNRFMEGTAGVDSVDVIVQLAIMQYAATQMLDQSVPGTFPEITQQVHAVATDIQHLVTLWEEAATENNAYLRQRGSDAAFKVIDAFNILADDIIDLCS